jgi:uncharacterized delta-60 repeat protein
LLTFGLPAGYPDLTYSGRFTNIHVGKADDVGAGVLQPDGKIVVAGSDTALDGSQTVALVRYLQNGQLDASFGFPVHNGVDELPSGSMIDEVYAVAVDQNQGSPEDGDIVVAGSWTDTNGQHELALARFRADGFFDTSFGTDGVVNDPTVANATGLALAIRPDDSIVVLGASDWPGAGAVPFVESFKPDGTPDPSFGVSGEPGVAFPFGGEPAALSGGLALDAAGNILVAGVEQSSTSSATVAVARLTSDGQPDRSFGSEGIATVRLDGDRIPKIVAGLAIDQSGHIVVAGTADFFGSSGSPGTPTSSDFWVARFGTDGNLDSSFNRGSLEFISFVQNGQLEFSSDAGVALAPDGKIVLAGETLGETGAGDEYSSNRQPVIALARLDADGTLDRSFGEGGLDIDPILIGTNAVKSVRSFQVQPDGNIVTDFTYQAVGGPLEVSNFGVARTAGHVETVPLDSGTIPAGIYHETFVTAANPTTPALPVTRFGVFRGSAGFLPGARLEDRAARGARPVRTPRARGRFIPHRPGRDHIRKLAAGCSCGPCFGRRGGHRDGLHHLRRYQRLVYGGCSGSYDQHRVGRRVARAGRHAAHAVAGAGADPGGDSRLAGCLFLQSEDPCDPGREAARRLRDGRSRRFDADRRARLRHGRCAHRRPASSACARRADRSAEPPWRPDCR